MTRQEVINRQTELFGHNTDLPAICMMLRAGVNGMADEWRPYRITKTLALLRARLDTWQENRSGTSPTIVAFDKAVRELIIATINDVESHNWWKESASLTRRNG